MLVEDIEIFKCYAHRETSKEGRWVGQKTHFDNKSEGSNLH